MAKKVNLAKAMLKNQKCLGYAYQMEKGHYEYQNDNDLGLDLEGIDCTQTYNKKVYVGNGYYFYVMRGIWGIKGQEYYPLTLKMVGMLLKECHPHLFKLSTREQNKLKKYWGFYGC